MPTPRWRVLLAEPLDERAEARLADAAEVLRPPADADLSTFLQAAIVDCDALVARTHTPVPRELLAAGKRLRVVGVAGVGLDNVDTAAAAELGVRVVHTPAASTDAVAELTLTLMLTLLRPAPRLAAAYAAGDYRGARARPHGDELRDLTIGIVGMGRIGARVGRICAAGFGARVLYTDIVAVGPFDFATEPVTLDELLGRSDFVTLHVPLTELTRGMLDAARLAQLRPTARLINTARGAVVDLDALTAALTAGRLAGAGLDVTAPEPLPPEHPLFRLPQCILTPHIAARTHAALRRMHAVVDEVLAALG